MRERAITWAPRLSRSVRTLAEDARKLHRAAGEQLARDVRRRAPRRTGRLRRSIRVAHGPTTSTVSYPAEYEHLDQGGTIRPERGGWLAIPVSPAVRTRTPSQDGRLISIRMLDGRVFLAARRGRNIEIRWRLVRSVQRRGTYFATGPVLETTHEITRTLGALVVKRTS